MIREILHIGKNPSISRQWQTNLEEFDEKDGYVNMNISFFLKTGNLVTNCAPALFHKHAVPERLSSQSIKI